jgi:spore coat polysaccharide biosynthesis protein SpsF
VVYVTGSCPLIDPSVVDAVIEEHVSGGHDYTSNFQPRTYPYGLEAEAIQFTALEEAWREARLAEHRERVTPFVHGQPDRYQLGSVTAGADYSQHRWAADRGEDLELIRRIYEALYREDPHFSWRDVLALVYRQPELASPGNR